ncbi:MAG: YdcF family protein [Pseudomonadota bacterium]
MFFYASKIIWFFLTPSNLLVTATAFGVLLLLVGVWRSLACLLAVGGVFGLLVAGYMPLGYALMSPLEERFPRPEALPETVDGIIVLGGFSASFVATVRGSMELNEAGERFAIIHDLAARYPAAPIIITGGAPRFFFEADTEAAIAESALSRYADRLVLEDQARNTAENATLTLDLLKPKPDQRFLLVTSAWHMPRSMGRFRAAGWTQAIPYPVDFRTAGPQDRFRVATTLSDGLRRVDTATREWIGLAAYFATGRTDQLFPEP